ncbi:MAG TPA: MFS transporter [Streptosporangiaceae bacterium]|jgi:MFS family permease
MDDTSAAERTRRAGRSILAASKRAGRAAAATTSGTSRFVHRLSGASGANRTGFSHLLELTAAGGVGDAFVAIALAGSLFFSASVSQAQGRAAVALLVTIAPYAILAPLIGPLLDRIRQGNKLILTGTLLARALLCWGMSGAINEPLTLLPAAFGILVLQKAYVVSRAAVTPRLLPPRLTLVTANARSNMASLIATSLGAAVALGIDKLAGGGGHGAAWVLRIGTVIYLAAMVPGLRLPSTVDAPAEDEAGSNGSGRADEPTARYTTPFPGESQRGAQARGASKPAGADGRSTIPLRSLARPRSGRRPSFLPQVGPVVGEAMRANAAIRAFYGFLLLFLAFILKTEHFGHVSDKVALGGLALAIAAGGMLGTGIGSALRSRWPQAMIFTVLGLATIASIACAILFGLPSVLIIALTAAISQTLVKVGLDSILQREIPEERRSSAFAFSETVHQLALVAGGLLGLVFSLTGSGFAGLTVAAAGLALALAWLLVTRRRRLSRARPPVSGPTTGARPRKQGPRAAGAGGR